VKISAPGNKIGIRASARNYADSQIREVFPHSFPVSGEIFRSLEVDLFLERKTDGIMNYEKKSEKACE